MSSQDIRIKSRSITQRTAGSNFTCESKLSKIKWQYSSRKSSVTTATAKECKKMKT